MQIAAKQWILRAIWLALTITLVGGACSRTEKPENLLRRFLTDLQNRDHSAAWKALSAASQQDLRERHRALVESSGQPIPEEPRYMLHSLRLWVLGQPESIVVASPIRDDVVMRVAVKGGRSAEIRMVRENEKWKVDLMGSLSAVTSTTTQN